MTLHPQSPMVVDVSFEFTRPAELTLAHLGDEGVRFARVDGLGPATSARWRVRGLEPGIQHELVASVRAGEETVDVPIEFTTLRAFDEFVGTLTPTVTEKEPEEVFRLFDVLDLSSRHASIYVYDRDGRPRWYWGRPVMLNGVNGTLAALKLDADGDVFFLHQYDFYEIDELGDIVEFIDSSQVAPDGMHHEVIELPNGNYMAVSHEHRVVELGDLGQTGVVGDRLVEFTAAGEVVWEWSSFDHLDVNRRLPGFEVMGATANPDHVGHDWTHGNGLEYDADTDTILFSMRHQDWIIKIDHVTGEVLWRLGADGDFTLQGPGRWFSHQHCPEWQPDGSLLLYDNGVDHPEVPDEEEVSRAVRYELDEVEMVAVQVWESAKQDEMSFVASDVDRLPGGHYLVLDSQLGAIVSNESRIREVDPSDVNEDVWEIRTPPGTISYRTIWSTRLPGEAAP